MSGLERGRIIKEISVMGQQPGSTKVKRSTIVYQHMRDPALLRYYYRLKMQPATSSMSIAGASPTDIFIGRYNYPKVYIGPMLPPEFGDTSRLGMPEEWADLSIESIVEFRSKLVRGMQQSNVKNVEKGRMEEQIRELAMAAGPADSEMQFLKRPFIRMSLSDEVQPYGPSALLRGFSLHNIKADQKIESMHSDTDAKSVTAITELYNRGVPVSRIQKALSAGLFGLKKRRKFVPTRWSITAVDDTLSKGNLAEVKGYDSVDAVYAYYHVSLDNRWLIIFMPGSWEYESAEAWYPGTAWNEDGKSISIYSSYEGFKGRRGYAEIGGCYYAARLAVTEKLKRLERQAAVLILREVHEGYLMPVGVWNVREHVRQALTMEPYVMHSMDEVFAFIKGRLSIPIQSWVTNSRMLKDAVSQRKLYSYTR